MIHYFKKVLLLCLLAPLFLHMACKENVSATCSYALELQAEVDALSAAASAYGTDPTPANCEAYRQAFLNYLDEADKLDSCVPQSERAAYRQSIDAAQASLDGLVC